MKGQSRRWLRASLSGLAALALTVAMLGCLTRLVERKDGYVMSSPFYEQEADFDVLFFGSSHMRYTISPPELWNDYGIVSYNNGSHASNLPTNYWTMINALDHTTPKLVVFDCYRMSSQVKGCDSPQLLHDVLDPMPLSLNKIRAVRDIVGPEENRGEYLWDFIAYHDRWRELGERDLNPQADCLKGSGYLVPVAEMADPVPIDPSMVFEEDTVGVQYLRKILDFCRDRNIKILLTFFPFTADEVNQRKANLVREIAKEYGVDYLDFLQLDVIDYGTDQCIDLHLNASGARKVTDYLGKYIREHYDIPDRRQDPAYAGWYEDYEAYTRFKLDTLEAQTDLKSYLMLLQDKHLSACVYLAENELWHSGVYERLLANTGVDSGQLRPEGPTLAVVDNMAGSVVYLGAGETAETGFGETRFVEKNGAYGVRINGGGGMILQSDASLGAVVVDNASGVVATSSQFAVTVQPAASSVTKIP